MTEFGENVGKRQGRLHVSQDGGKTWEELHDFVGVSCQKYVLDKSGSCTFIGIYYHFICFIVNFYSILITFHTKMPGKTKLEDLVILQL